MKRGELPCAPVSWSDGNPILPGMEATFQTPPVQPLYNVHRPQPGGRVCSSPVQMWSYSCKELCYSKEKPRPCVWKSSAAVAPDFSSELELPCICWLYGTKEAKLLSTAESCALLTSPFGRAIFQPFLARSQSEPFLAGITANRKIMVLTAFNYHGWNIIVVSLGPDVGLESLKVTFPRHNETCFTWDSLKPINYAGYKNLL